MAENTTTTTDDRQMDEIRASFKKLCAGKSPAEIEGIKLQIMEAVGTPPTLLDVIDQLDKVKALMAALEMGINDIGDEGDPLGMLSTVIASELKHARDMVETIRTRAAS